MTDDFLFVSPNGRAIPKALEHQLFVSQFPRAAVSIRLLPARVPASSPLSRALGRARTRSADMRTPAHRAMGGGGYFGHRAKLHSNTSKPGLQTPAMPLFTRRRESETLPRSPPKPVATPVTAPVLSETSPSSFWGSPAPRAQTPLPRPSEGVGSRFARIPSRSECLSERRSLPSLSHSDSAASLEAGRASSWWTSSHKPIPELPGGSLPLLGRANQPVRPHSAAQPTSVRVAVWRSNRRAGTASGTREDRQGRDETADHGGSKAAGSKWPGVGAARTGAQRVQVAASAIAEEEDSSGSDSWEETCTGVEPSRPQSALPIQQGVDIWRREDEVDCPFGQPSRPSTPGASSHVFTPATSCSRRQSSEGASSSPFRIPTLDFACASATPVATPTSSQVPAALETTPSTVALHSPLLAADSVLVSRDRIVRQFSIRIAASPSYRIGLVTLTAQVRRKQLLVSVMDPATAKIHKREFAQSWLREHLPGQDWRSAHQSHEAVTSHDAWLELLQLASEHLEVVVRADGSAGIALGDERAVS